MSLADRVALVTGANHGIGAATARALAAAGAAVLLSYLRLEDQVDTATPEPYRAARTAGAEEMVKAIEAAGGQAVAVEADLADPSTPSRLFDEAERAFGPVAILINNASSWVADTFGAQTTDRFERRLRPVSVETFDRQFAVDARGSALLIAEFARRHIARGGEWGRIIGLTSGGPLGFPEEVSYGAAKSALENYTMSAAFELGEYGITANVVYPPVTDTGWVTADIEKDVWRSGTHFHVAQPEEVAEVIVFLASQHARLLTGNVIHLR